MAQRLMDGRASVRVLTLGLVGVLALTGLVAFPVAPAAATDYPGQDDIEAARAAASDAAAGVSQLDAAIAQLEDALHEADVAARLADVDFQEAQEANVAAQRNLYAANARADEAEQALAQAKTGLASVAMAAYRSAGSFDEFEALVKSDGFDEVVQRSESIDRASADADATVQQVHAAEIVAATTREYAETAAVEADAAAAAAEDALETAQSSREGAQQAVAEAASARDAAIARAAELRGVTAELERERQDGLAVERQARQQAQFEEEQQRLAQADAAEQEREGGSSGGNGGTPTSNQTGGTNGNANPQPRPTQTSQPDPVQTSDPEPTETSQPDPVETTPPPAPDPTPEPSNSWRSSAGQGATAAGHSLTLKGAPYSYGGNGPAYDCSGLTSAAWRKAGISIPRSSRTQYAGVSLLPYSQLRKGDLVFWGSGKNASAIYHVAIYVGGGMVMEATTPGNTAKTRSMYNWAVGDMMPYIGRP